MNILAQILRKLKCLTILVILLLTACSGLSGFRGKSKTIPIASPLTQNIALLVPLQGRYANQGQAIRNGFLAAYYQDKKMRGVKSQIRILNTTHLDIQTLYQQALSEGTNTIAGPLTKANVKKLQQLPALKIPVLALNTLPNTFSTHNLYQFSLSPLDEAQQVAQKAFGQGYRRALVITPNTSKGKQIGNAMAKQWKNQGGQLISLFFYSGNTQTLSTEIAKLLQFVDTQKNEHQEIILPPQRRQDIDVILLSGTPTKAQAIRGLLKFYYAGNIPIYATSSIYSKQMSTIQNKELDGVYFCVMPWEVNSLLSKELMGMRKHIAALWAKSYQHYSHFYALGIDAYHLIAHTPDNQNGATGYLYTDAQHKIRRILPWVKMVRGIPMPIKSTNE